MKKLEKLDENQYWQLVGLLSLSKNHYEQIKYIEEAIADTLGIKGDDGYYGHISDMVWNGDVKPNDLLKKLDIKEP